VKGSGLMITMIGAAFLALTVGTFVQLSQSDSTRIHTKRPLSDRGRLPPALRKVPLEHRCSGALMLQPSGTGCGFRGACDGRRLGVEGFLR